MIGGVVSWHGYIHCPGGVAPSKVVWRGNPLSPHHAYVVVIDHFNQVSRRVPVVEHNAVSTLQHVVPGMGVRPDVQVCV